MISELFFKFSITVPGYTVLQWQTQVVKDNMLETHLEAFNVGCNGILILYGVKGRICSSTDQI